MKACESVQNYPSRVREMSNYTVREVKKVCTQTGPRESGSQQEEKALQYAAQSMENVCDSVESEKFSVSPKAFALSVTVSALLILISAAGFIACRLNVLGAAGPYVGIVTLVLSVAAAVVLAGEFILLKKIIDPFFSKTTAENVIFTRKASGETKRRIVFAGNMDSSYEWRYSGMRNGRSSIALIYVLLAVAVIYIILNAAALFHLPQAADVIMLVIAALGIVPAVMGLAFINLKTVSQGANSNLTGAFACMAVLRFMDANKIRFENTEVSALSTACRECGTRGAQAYAKEHKNDGVETVIIAVDTLHDFDNMRVAVKDKHTGTALDPKAAALLKKAAENAGYNIDIGPSVLMTESAAFKGAGINSAALSAANPENAGFYHTALDTADKLSLKAVEAGISVLIEAAFLYDEQGLKNEY